MTAEPLTPAQRKMRASIAALARWANEPDRTTTPTRGQAGLLDKFEKQVDPDGVLDPETRKKLADAARRAHMRRLALASSRARSARKTGGA